MLDLAKKVNHVCRLFMFFFLVRQRKVEDDIS